MKKKLLITGASGFIGSHCLSLLDSGEYEIHAVSSKSVNGFQKQAVTWHQIDLLDEKQCSEMIIDLRPSHILHIAWHVVPGMKSNYPSDFLWVKSGLNLIQSFAKNGGQRIVVAGTCAEYDWKHGFLSETLTPLNPKGTYGTCKHAFQMLLGAFCEHQGISWSWGRIFFTFGPHENPNRLVPYIIRTLLKGRQADCTHGKQVRDYLYVLDVADALVKLLKSDIQGPINISSGVPVQQKTIIGEIAQKMKVGSELVRLGAKPTGKNDPPFIVGSNQRIKSELNWQPKIGLDRGLLETINWWKQKEFKVRNG